MSLTAAETALAALRTWVARAGPEDASYEPPPEFAARIGAVAALIIGNQRPGWRKRSLLSIFACVNPNDTACKPPEVYVQRRALALDDTLFPTLEEPALDDTLRATLAKEVEQIDKRGLPAEQTVEALLYALQRYAWCLPSPLPAVSLADFARTVAAVAAAQSLAGGDLFLLGGDLSGVQSFLYTLTADGATKSLRGRSFYLQLLCDACARYLLRAAGLPLTNLLYSGGGRFYALLPRQVDNIDTREWLEKQRAFFDAFFLRHHQGDLYLALGGYALPLAAVGDAAGKAFSDAWGNATENANAAKRRRFSALGADGLKALFAPEGAGYSCSVCDYQGDEREFEPIDSEDVQSDVQCQLCQSFEQLGRLLHNAEYLLLHHTVAAKPDQKPARRPWHVVLGELGVQVQVRGKRVDLNDPANKRKNLKPDWTTVLALDTDAAKGSEEQLAADWRLNTPVVLGFRPVANASPTVQSAVEVQLWQDIKADDDKPVKRGDVKPFSLMVDQSKGVKRLGVLRMDVDDLGDLFRFQLDGGLARVSALSAALALFFEGRVGWLCDQCNEAQSQRIYSIYSGGDDLFIVGSWDELPDLARAIRDDLLRYTGRHPDVHLSAGISLHTAKFPLYQAAEAADKELKRAKARPGKNALGWLEQVVGWEYADELFELKRRLLDYTGGRDDTSEPAQPTTGEQPVKGGPPLSRAVLQTLQVLYSQYDAGLKDHARKKLWKLFYGPWIWRGVYQLSRIKQQARASKHPRADEAAEYVKGLAEGLLGGAEQPPNTGGRAIERNGLAARWVQLLIRKEQD